MVDEWARQGSPLRWALRHPGLVAGLHRRTHVDAKAPAP